VEIIKIPTFAGNQPPSGSQLHYWFILTNGNNSSSSSSSSSGGGGGGGGGGGTACEVATSRELGLLLANCAAPSCARQDSAGRVAISSTAFQGYVVVEQKWLKNTFVPDRN
jgi:hypothetical protein